MSGKTNITTYISKVLSEDFVRQHRPISQLEFKDMRNYLYWKLHLSDKNISTHDDCGHSYKLKVNFVKHKNTDINSDDKTSHDNRKCLVCNKLSKIDKSQLNVARYMVDTYNRNFDKTFHRFEIFTYMDYDLEKTYYEWLYERV